MASPKARPKTPMSEPTQAIVFISPDGKTVIEYETVEPTIEQLTVMGLETAQPIDATNLIALFRKVNSLFNFLDDILVKPGDIDIIKERLRDRNDALTLESVMDSFTDYITDQTGFPTQEPSGSSPTDSRTGGRSTGRMQPGE